MRALAVLLIALSASPAVSHETSQWRLLPRPDAPRGGPGTFQALWATRVSPHPGVGVASFYDDPLTATGERLRPHDRDRFTCSRPDAGDLGQCLKVSRGVRVLFCRVNDIGPAKRLRRPIDLTPAGFEALGMHKGDGLGIVRIERVAADVCDNSR